MSLFGKLRSRLFPGAARAVDREIDEEIRFHLEMRQLANIRAGMSASEARRAAARSFGDADAVRAAGRSILTGAPPARDGARWHEVILQDIRFGMRMLGRNRAMTAVAILSLALGIGANAANFSIAYALVYRPLPFERPYEILYLDSANAERQIEDAGLTWADLEQARADELLEGVAGYDDRNFTITGGDQPERLLGARVTPDLFPLLGIEPILGRQFRPDEGAEAGFEPVAMISHSLWLRRFGGDPDALGQALHINGREIVLVGVMPPGFRFPERQDLWVPLGTEDPTQRQTRFMVAAARLRPGATIEQVNESLAAASVANAEQFPETDLNWQLRAQPFRHGLIGARARQLMTLLMASVGFVLLLACANVANLLLARATDRQGEMALRAALGAGRLRLIRQMITESVLLGLAGGVLGLVVAEIWLWAVWRSIPEELSYWMRVELDAAVIAYMVALSIGTGLLFGLLPAMQGSKADLGAGLRESGRRSSGGAGRGRARQALVVAEVVLSVVLLTGALLMMSSFLSMQEADLGFDDSALLSMRIVLSGDQFDEVSTRTEYFRSVVESVGALPGVAGVAATSSIPADDGGPSIALVAEGGARADDQALAATAVLSTHGFFAAIGAPLLAGREFTGEEMTATESEVAIVGASLAQALWPGQDAVGRRLRLVDQEQLVTVVGVAPDLQYEEISEETERSRLQLHLPYGRAGWRGMALLIRSAGDPGSLTGPVRDRLERIDALQAPYDIMTMQQRRALTIWPQKISGQSSGLFGLFALLLAVSGVYAVISYSVSRRTHEMGVRIALGASPGDVSREVVLDAVRIALTGVVVGCLLGLLSARAMSGLLYGVAPNDPRIFLAVGLLLLASAVLAAWVPARRAARVDPTEALRSD